MLKLKSGLCPLCDDNVAKSIIAGLCAMHYWAGRRASTKAPSRERAYQTYIREGQDERKIEQEVWYDQRIKTMSSWCWECGSRIVTSNRKIAKAAIAHIFDKDFFVSIAIHDLNYMVLGSACGCHNRWDNNWAGAIKMKVFPIALERFIILEPLIALSEKRGIPEFFYSLKNAK